MKFGRHHFSLPDFPLLLIGCSITLSIAAYFRYFRLDELLVFATDQGRALLAGRSILFGNVLLTGPLTSLSGFSLGPFYYYLSALALKLSGFDPLGPAVMTATFGVATAVAIFLFLKKFWGGEVAIFGGILYAFSPLAAIQSRIAIEPSPLPFFTLLWLWLTTQWLRTENMRLFWLSTLTIFFATQLNFSAIIFLPIMGLTWLVVSNAFVPARKATLFTFFALFLLFAQLYKSAVGPITSAQYLSRIWLALTADNVFLGTLLFGIAIFGLWRIYSRARRKSVPATLIVTWIIVSFLAFLLKNVSGDHALAILFPAAPILIAIGLEPLFQGKVRLVVPVAAIVFFLVLGYSANGRVFQGKDLTIHDHQKIVDKVIELAGEKPYELIYRGHLDVYDAADDHYQYLLWRAGNPPAQSFRIESQEPLRERWLLERQPAEKTIILYYPWYEADRYISVGTRRRFENVIFEIIDK